MECANEVISRLLAEHRNWGKSVGILNRLPVDPSHPKFGETTFWLTLDLNLLLPWRRLPAAFKSDPP